MMDIVEACYNYNGYGGMNATLTGASRDDAYSFYVFLFRDTAFGSMDMCFYIAGNSMIGAVFYEDNEPGTSKSQGAIQYFLQDAGYDELEADLEETLSYYLADITEDAGSIFGVATK